MLLHVVVTAVFVIMKRFQVEKELVLVGVPMLKIESTVKRKYLGDHMISQLAPFHQSEMKGLILFLLFAWLDLFCMIAILTKPTMTIYIVFFLVPVGLMHVWAVRLLVKDYYSTQVEALYFIALLACLAMYGSFLMMVQYMHLYLEGSIMVSFLLISFYFIGWIVYFGQYTLRKYKNRRWNIQQKNYMFEVLILVLCLYPGFGRYNAQRILEGHPYEYQLRFGIIAIIVVFFIYLAVLYVHKLVYIQVNRNYFRYREPSKKERKRMEANGKKLIVK